MKKKGQKMLRSLRESDLDGMLEWMHDKEIAGCFRHPFLETTREEAREFIRNAGSLPVEGESIHLAIEETDGSYLGTISLKDIDTKDSSAEYAISTRRKAWGRGIAEAATRELINKAFNEYGLGRIFLNVLKENTRAQRLYEKCGFKRISPPKGYEGDESLFWYEIRRD